MPYEKITQLPSGVTNNLPKHAQEIYKSAYNNALEEYDDDERAHRTAWGAVKKSYEKQGGNWVKKN